MGSSPSRIYRQESIPSKPGTSDSVHTHKKSRWARKRRGRLCLRLERDELEKGRMGEWERGENRSPLLSHSPFPRFSVSSSSLWPGLRHAGRELKDHVVRQASTQSQDDNEPQEIEIDGGVVACPFQHAEEHRHR